MLQHRCDDQGGPQPPKPGWNEPKPTDKPKPEDNQGDEEQQKPA